jgi:hypothetical protein
MSALWCSRDKAQEAEVETLFLSVFERDSDAERKAISLYLFSAVSNLESGAKLISKLKRADPAPNLAAAAQLI